MKKLTIIALAILGMATATAKADEVIYENGKFILVETQKSQQKKAEPLRVPDYPVKDRDGNVHYYPCYISKGGKGSAYIIRPKADNPNELYKVYLGKEKTEKIKKQLKIEE